MSLIQKGSEAVAVSGPSDMLSALTQILQKPELLQNIEALDRFLAMHERVTKEQQRIAFQDAMARLAPKLHPIAKRGKGHNRNYALLEDMDIEIRPLLAEEGFSQSYDSAPCDGGKVRILCKLSHSAGHFETKQIDIPIEKSGNMNSAQAVKTAISYGRRILTQMFFNLMDAGDDTDGVNPETINVEQVRDLKAFMEEVKADVPRFLVFMKVKSVEDILQRDLKKANEALEEKRRGKR